MKLRFALMLSFTLTFLFGKTYLIDGIDSN